MSGPVGGTTGGARRAPARPGAPVMFGGDYNPEQWGADVHAEDDLLMARARVNTATVGVFSWSVLEPEPGRYTFDWLDATMDRLHANGVKVVLATPTASPPPWFTTEHPDALPVGPDGVQLWHGSRDTYCACAPAYREASLAIAEQLARRYADHPALAMWHVHNEYGTYCWCEHVAGAFRRWLQRRYGEGGQGLEALNHAWNGPFWSQAYARWQDVQPPRATQYLGNPGQHLDFKRFFSDELLDCYREQRDLLRRFTPEVPITTNLMLPDYQNLDLWAFGDELDQVAVDIYPSGTGVQGAAQFAFGADRARSFNGGEPWLLMEQAPAMTLGGGLIQASPPGTTVRQSISAVGRGSDAVMYFQWRPGAGGAETFHSTMVPHAGPDTRTFDEITRLGAVLTPLAEVTGSRVDPSPVALLWSADAWWAGDGPGQPSTSMGFLPLVEQAHRVLWQRGVTADVVRPGADLCGYRAVLVPSLHLLDAAGAQALADYVAGGGHLLVGPFTGVVDGDRRVHRGGFPGAGLRDVLGVRVTEWHPLPPGSTLRLVPAVGPGHAPGTADAADATITALDWAEDLEATGAEVLRTYADGALAGRPALTRRVLEGGGTARYLSAKLDDTDLGTVVDGLLADAAVPARQHPVGVEVLRRTADDGRSWLFVVDHAGDGARVAADGVELVSGAEVVGEVEVAPFGVAVVRLAR